MIYTYTMNNNKDYIIKYDNVKRLATEEEIDNIISAENVALNNFVCLGKINEISKAEIDKIFKDENLCKEFYEMRQDLFNILMNTLEGDKYGFLPFEVVDDKYIYTNNYRVVDMEGNHIGCIFKEIDIYDLYEQAKEGDFISYVSVSKDLHNGKYEELHGYVLMTNEKTEIENVDEIYKDFKIALRKKYNDNDYSISSPFTIKVK